MTLKIYHQVGHNNNWNTDSFQKDGCGNGLILSPVHQAKSKIEEMQLALRQSSIFDPQYYLPNSQKKKLATYPFFPEVISEGFKTTDFHMDAHSSAEMCLDFQVTLGFEKIIIPVRYIDQMKTDYFEQQEEYSVKPFLKVIKAKGIKKQIFATLALTSHMIEDVGFRTKVLNWITGFPEISGVYLLVTFERDTKQIKSETFLKSYLDFLVTLKEVDLEVIAGHLNTESLIYSLVDDISLSFGSFENTRIFSIDKFVESEEDRRGPKARIYIPKLLNWIQYSQAKEILKANPTLWNDIYTPTKYSDDALAAAIEPTFNQPQLYKHHFICFYQQIQKLSLVSPKQRFQLLSQWINEARVNYSKISSIGIQIESHGNNQHLLPWQNAINYFNEKYL
jgi:hypothetical protein